MESRTPPLPSIINPESLTSAERFKTDSTRSPIFAITERISAITAISHNETGITCGL